MSKLLPVIITGIIVIAAGIFVLSNRNTKFQLPPTVQSPSLTNQASEKPNSTFTNPKKSAHYESNTPEHGVILAGVPVNVVINFNFDLVKPSEITIENGEKDYGVGDTTIDNNKLAMRRALDTSAPDGIYTIDYKACWSDGSCHEGSFQFAIDRTKVKTYTDLRSKNGVTVDLADIAFAPQNIRISRGTKVTWTNSDSVEHYINTDSHPAHTYYPSQNSKSLKKGNTYSITFDKIGEYPYHCSAHAGSMVGSILVE